MTRAHSLCYTAKPMCEKTAMQPTCRLPISLFVLILALFLSALFIPSIGYAVGSGEHGDYPWHHDIAMRYSNGENIGTPHVIYHILVIFLQDLFGLEVLQIAALLATAFRVGTGIILYFVLRSQTHERLPDKLVLLIVCIFLFSAPTYTAMEPNTLFFSPIHTVYQSPTQNLLFMLVVPMSLLAMRTIIPQPFKSLNQRVFFTLLFALFTLIASLSKPSYSIALLPSLMLIVVYRLIRRLPIDWWLLILGVVLPQVIVLGVQYVVTYNDPNRASVGIGFLAFAQAIHMTLSEAIVRTVLSFALVIAFPAIVYLLHYKQARRDDYLNFAWLTFGISCIWTYFFYEGGVRFSHVNFFSTGHSAMFVLMFSSVLFLVKHYSAPRSNAALTQPTV